MNLASPRFIRGNRGDIASRYGILKTVLHGGASVSAVFASRAAHLPQALQRSVLPYGLVYNLWPRWQGIQALRRASAVIWTGGLDLQDDSSLTKLLAHLARLRLLPLSLGLKILVALQGAGPLTTSLGRWLAARILALTNLVLVRDQGSYRLLSAILPENRLRLAADGIFLPGFPERGERLRSAPGDGDDLRAADGRPLIGLNVRLWFHFAKQPDPLPIPAQEVSQTGRGPNGDVPVRSCKDHQSSCDRGGMRASDLCPCTSRALSHGRTMRPCFGKSRLSSLMTQRSFF